MINKTYLSLCIAFMLSACSGSGGGGGGAQPSSPQSPWNSYFVTTVSDLPSCSGDIVGRLYYIETDNNFQVCKTSGWTTISIRGADGTNGTNGTNGSNGSNGISISSRWAYHVDTYVGATSISESSGSVVYIGDVQLVKFSDNSCLISTSGLVGNTDSGGSDIYYQDFSYSYFDISCTTEKTATKKIQQYADTRIRLKYNASLATPTFKATVDIDSNFGNNTDNSFTLTQQ